MTKVTLYFFRHGETDWNKNGLVQGGASDIPLNDTGRAQCQELVTKLKDRELEAILSSDMERAYETGEIVANALKIPIFHTTGLVETNYGKAEGMGRKEARELYKDILAQIDDLDNPNRNDISFPDGETCNDVFERMVECLQVFISHNDYNTLGISTHGGAMRTFLNMISNEQRSFKNCEVLEIHYDQDEKIFTSSGDIYT